MAVFSEPMAFSTNSNPSLLQNRDTSTLTRSASVPRGATTTTREPRRILSGETLVLAECEAPRDGAGGNGTAVVSNRCISLQGKALLRMTKVAGSAGIHVHNGDIVQIECGFGLVLRGHSFSKYMSWKTKKSGGEKAAFRVHGIGNEQALLSQSCFHLESVKWEGYYLGKEESYMANGNGDEPVSTHGCLALTKDSANWRKIQKMYLCALPARLSFGNDVRYAHIREMLDRALQRESSTAFAYVTQFRTVRASKLEKRTVHMERIQTFQVENSEKYTKMDCSICLSGFEVGENVCTLPCVGQHVFHDTCIEQWLMQKSSCPMCVDSLHDLVTVTQECTNRRQQNNTLPAETRRVISI